jgi:rhamnosyltransferase
VYYPDENLLRNIKSYVDEVEFLMIWENSPLSDKENYLKALPADKIRFMGTGQNVGLGKAYNEAVGYAKEQAYTHLMTMDQDSCFVNFSGFRQQIEKETDQTIGMYLPFYNQDAVYVQEPFEVKLGMQSGGVFPIGLFDQIGLFREDFFIGGIDNEINFRIRRNGYKCVRYSNCNLIHTVGSCREVFIGKRKFVLTDYSPIRRFYTIKNEFFLFREYPEYEKKDRIKFFRIEIGEFIKIILWEKDKTAKIGAMLKGAFYGLFAIDKTYKEKCNRQF